MRFLRWLDGLMTENLYHHGRHWVGLDEQTARRDYPASSGSAASPRPTASRHQAVSPFTRVANGLGT